MDLNVFSVYLPPMMNKIDRIIEGKFLREVQKLERVIVSGDFNKRETFDIE
jgi:hypothetical protein